MTSGSHEWSSGADYDPKEEACKNLINDRFELQVRAMSVLNEIEIASFERPYVANKVGIRHS